MKHTHKLRYLIVAAWLGIAGSSSAQVANKALVNASAVPLTPQAYEAAKKRIEAQYRADRRTCGRLKGAPRDICDAQAEGRKDSATARLEARYRRTPDAVEQAKIVTAEANYKVARQKCEALKGRAEDRCIDQAKAAREAAIRQARVEKVESTGGVFGRKAAEGAGS